MADDSVGVSFVESTHLFAQCNSGDVTVQAQGYQSLWPYLYRIALHLVRDQADADALAQDCAQAAMLQIHLHMADCHEPKAFRSWTKRIVSNLCIDELRRRNRRPLTAETPEEVEGRAGVAVVEAAEITVVDWESSQSIRQGLRQAPISDRSYRSIVGRYLDDLPDEELAQQESAQSGQVLMPSHLQVTRAKNLSKLRKWEGLSRLLG